MIESTNENALYNCVLIVRLLLIVFFCCAGKHLKPINMLVGDHVSHRLVKPIVQWICQLNNTGQAYSAETSSEKIRLV